MEEERSQKKNKNKKNSNLHSSILHSSFIHSFSSSFVLLRSLLFTFSSSSTLLLPQIQANPKDEVLFSNRSAAKLKGGDAAGAAEDAATSLSLNDSYWKAYSRLGDALFVMTNYQDALEAYLRFPFFHSFLLSFPSLLISFILH